jgi:tRNA(Glu) U13 pseudouridine synthase TruD
LTLSFSLPAGSYATMLLKLLCARAGGIEWEEGR